MVFSKMYELISFNFFEKIERIYNKMYTNKDMKERYTDLELGLCSNLEIEETDGILDNEGFHMLENYVSYMVIVNYLSSPLEERNKTPLLLFVMKDKLDESKLKNYKVNMVFQV
jgi:uncharacterized protein YktA (UPF0223 family)